MANGIWMLLLAGAALLAMPHAHKKPLSAGALLAIVCGFLFGPISALWGLWGLVSAALNLGWVKAWPLLWGTAFFSALAQVFTGSLLGLRAVQLIAGFDWPLLRRALLPAGLFTLALGIWNIATVFLFNAP